MSIADHFNHIENKYEIYKNTLVMLRYQLGRDRKILEDSKSDRFEDLRASMFQSREIVKQLNVALDMVIELIGTELNRSCNDAINKLAEGP